MHGLFRRRILKWWQKEFWSRKSSLAELKGMQWWLVKEKWGHAVPSSPALTTIQCVWAARSQHQLQLSLTIIKIKIQILQLSLFCRNQGFLILNLRFCLFHHFCLNMQFLISIYKLDENFPAEEFGAMQFKCYFPFLLYFTSRAKDFFFLNVLYLYIFYTPLKSKFSLLFCRYLLMFPLQSILAE